MCLPQSFTAYIEICSPNGPRAVSSSLTSQTGLRSPCAYAGNTGRQSNSLAFPWVLGIQIPFYKPTSHTLYLHSHLPKPSLLLLCYHQYQFLTSWQWDSCIPCVVIIVIIAGTPLTFYSFPHLLTSFFPTSPPPTSMSRIHVCMCAWVCVCVCSCECVCVRSCTSSHSCCVCVDGSNDHHTQKTECPILLPVLQL